MIVVASLEAVALVVTVWLLLRRAAKEHAGYVRTLATLSTHWDAERVAAAAERRELLTRIQRPEYIPPGPSVAFEIPEREADEWAKVGQIDISDDYGLGDDA